MAPLFLIFCLILSWSNNAASEELLVAVAANFMPAAKQLAQRFEQSSNHQIKWVLGSSGKHYAQIMHGAPYDAFLSADQDKVNKLVLNNKAQVASQFTYARGQLAIYAHKAKNLNLKALLNVDAKLAVANPKLAPYGLAAKYYLQQQKLWQPLSQARRIVRGENIGQAFQFVYTQAADVGLVALSQLKALKVEANQYQVIDANLYPAIVQDAVILTSSKKQQLAEKFFTFLKSQQAQTIIQQFGYLPAPEPVG